MNQLHKIGLFLMLLALGACANRGVGPQGGPKDETPPAVVKSTPENGALNCKEKEIEILFDEYIQLDDVSNQVLISPPQQRPPEVKAYGKKMHIEFDGELLDSTTYTIHFGKAICDYTEKNALSDYTFSFSTGDWIDTLQVSGQLLNAEDLNPVSGIIVGLHANQHDSALATVPFRCIGKTDAEGRFTIKNIPAGDYRIYALGDISKDYIYQAGEGLAFVSEDDSAYLITPKCQVVDVSDTIAHDSICQRVVDHHRVSDTLRVVDSVVVRRQNAYTPSNLQLIYFKENKTAHYFVRSIREQPHFFRIYFSAPQDSLPVLTPISLDSLPVFDWLPYTLCQSNPTRDTLTYWLTDSVAIRLDTLAFEMTYYKSDSLYQLAPQTDTIRAIYRAPFMSDKARERMEKEKAKNKPVLKITSNASASFDVYRSLLLSFATPVQRVEKDSIALYLVVNDSTKRPLAYEQVWTDSSHTALQIVYKWKAENKYELQVDSAAFVDIYGVACKENTFSLTLRKLEDYSSLTVNVEPYNDKVIVQLLNDKDKVVRTLPANAEGTLFQYLDAGTYYLRLFIDEDGDGEWTTGDWNLKRQPEKVYYFSQKLSLRANWDFEETFSYLALPIDKQKPSELRKDANAKKK